MKARGLQQAGLAEVLGVSLDRVKSLTSGRVKKLTSEESTALVRKGNVRAEWLISGEGPMLQGDELQPEFANWLEHVNHMTALAQALPLSEFERNRLAAQLTGEAAQDAALIAEAIRSGSISGQVALLAQDKEMPPYVRQISQRELDLLGYYFAADDAGKFIIESVAELAARPKAGPGGQ